jgi:phage terminase small subunit
MLNARQVRFVTEYCLDGHATHAAIRAGYSEKTAYSIGSRLLKNVEVAAAIEAQQTEHAAAIEVNPNWVLKQWFDIATADVNELIQLRRVCCRYCWGVGHRYQWTPAEYRDALDKALADGSMAPDGLGGFGYDCQRNPCPECPECCGDGETLVYVADTRKLSGPAARLYAGVQKSRDGATILMRDQDAALANIAKYLGMMVDRKELSGPGGGPVPVAALTVGELTDDQLLAIIAHGGSDDDASVRSERPCY